MAKSSQTITIIIADDEQIFREGVNLILQNNSDLSLIGQAANGEELIKLAQELKPGIIFNDIKMSKLDGILTTRYIRKEFPKVGIIALSISDEEHTIAEMLLAGANAYLSKYTDGQEILTAIKTVNMGRSYYCQCTTRKLEEMTEKSIIEAPTYLNKIKLLDKELEIIRLVCKGLSNKEIAEKLDVSKKSIDSYKERIMAKLKVKNTVGIVIYAVNNELVD